jgi:hypothetical protein
MRDVRVIQCRERLRFTGEPCQTLRIGRESGSTLIAPSRFSFVSRAR